MNLKAQRAAALKAAQDIINEAKGAERDLTADEQTTIAAKFAEVDELDTKIKAAADSDALMGRIESFGPVSDEVEIDGAKTIGEHFVKSVGEQGLARVKTVTGTVVAAPEFKANTDSQERPASLAPSTLR